jgi:hypothetical protein
MYKTKPMKTTDYNNTTTPDPIEADEKSTDATLADSDPSTPDVDPFDEDDLHEIEVDDDLNEPDAEETDFDKKDK